MTFRDARRRTVAWLAIQFGWALLSTLHRMVRVRSEGRGRFDAIRASGEPLLIAIWHGHILLPILEHKGQGIVPMISLSRDGEMITRTVEKLGYRSIRGSSSRGGSDALAAMVSELKTPGTVAAIMPDGPRGPRHSVKPGVVRIARGTGAWVMPMAWSGRRMWTFGSWDHFQLWKPFARAAVVYGEAFRLPEDGDFDAQKEQVRAALMAVCERAEALAAERT